jgi:DNA-binding LacI/PurR family transcriptional regulator
VAVPKLKFWNSLNYVSNMSGRALGRYGSKLIGVVINFDRRKEVNAVRDPFLGGITGCLEHEIRKAGYFMMLYISANVEESLRMAASRNVGGLIAAGCNADGCLRFMEGARELQIPVVFIDGCYYGDEFCFVNTGLQDRSGGYSALFFASDYLAAGGVNLFQDEGLRVPRDLSVAGFDDNVFACTVRPRLTTVKQDISQKAYFAVQQVLGLIRKVPPEPAHRQILLPASLVVRDAVAKAG